jgi:hydroxymethylpyrimidine/phosphomethylpyrimidine kinase
MGLDPRRAKVGRPRRTRSTSRESDRAERRRQAHFRRRSRGSVRNGGQPVDVNRLPLAPLASPPSSSPRRVLTIAGSDSGGGAGIQADLKTFAAHGVYGLCAVTAVTAQNTVEVRAVAAVPPEVVAAQIDAVLDDFGVDAVKIGMLWSAETARVVAARLRAHLGPGAMTAGAGLQGETASSMPPRRRVPIVLDPVMAAETGAALLAGDAAETVAVLVEELLPMATLVTPNLPELARLVQALRPAPAAPGRIAGIADKAPAPPAGEAARLAMARQLAALGPAVLAKGGHDAAPAAEEVVDLLLIAAGGEGGAERVVRFAGPRLATRATHGTGCTLSAAVAARLAAGEELAVAVGGAVDYVRQAMAAAPPLGGGQGPLAHFHDLRHGNPGVLP